MMSQSLNTQNVLDEGCERSHGTVNHNETDARSLGSVDIVSTNVRKRSVTWMFEPFASGTTRQGGSTVVADSPI